MVSSQADACKHLHTFKVSPPHALARGQTLRNHSTADLLAAFLPSMGHLRPVIKGVRSQCGGASYPQRWTQIWYSPMCGIGNFRCRRVCVCHHTTTPLSGSTNAKGVRVSQCPRFHFSSAPLPNWKIRDGYRFQSGTAARKRGNWQLSQFPIIDVGHFRSSLPVRTASTQRTSWRIYSA